MTTLVCLGISCLSVACNDDDAPLGPFGTTPSGGATAAASGGTNSSSGTTAVGGTPAAGGTPATTTSVAPAAPTPATVTASADGMCKFPTSYAGNGSLTWYLFAQGSKAVNCSYAITGNNPDTVEFVTYGAGQYFAALNTADYSTASMCGACVEVTRDGGRTVTATVVDQCPVGSNPKCKAGHLDLSKAAFLQVGSEGEGYLGTGNGGAAGAISWKYVPCNVQGNVFVRFKEPANKFWNELLVENHRNPIERFEILAGTAWLQGTRQLYNYWNWGNTLGLPKQIRITDIHGAVIEANLGYPTDGTGRVELAAQFPTCN